MQERKGIKKKVGEVTSTKVYTASDESARWILNGCLCIYLPIHPFIYGPTALCWTLAAFTQSLGLLGRGISPWQGRYLHTQDNTNTEYTHTDNYAASGIRTRNPSVRAGEDGHPSITTNRRLCLWINM
jgi:hypothetical protein